MEAQTDELVSHLGSVNEGLRYIQHIKKLSRTAALADIGKELPNASDKLREWLISFVPEYIQTANISKAKLYSILWICGATYGQIAHIFGVKKATVHSSVAGCVSIQIRNELMSTRSNFTVNLTPTAVSAIHEIINEWLSSDDRYKFMVFGDILTIASAISKEYEARMAEFTEDAPSPYDALVNAPESRLGS